MLRAGSGALPMYMTPRRRPTSAPGIMEASKTTVEGETFWRASVARW